MRRVVWILASIVVLMPAACSDGRPTASSVAEDTAARLQALYNQWDNAEARALFGDRAATVKTRFSWFRSHVGACDEHNVLYARSSHDVRFVYECDSGQFEAQIRVDPETGAIRGMLSGVRGVEPPTPVVALALRVLETQPRAWDALESDFPRLGSDHLKALESGLHYIEDHGPCELDRVHLASNTGALFVLGCRDASPTIVIERDENDQMRRFRLVQRTLDAWRDPNPSRSG